MANVAELVVAVGADLKEVKTKLNELGKHIRSAEKDTNGLGKSFDAIKGQIAAALSVGALIGFGKAIIDTTAEFEKFEAVLTNTLGSKSAAQRAMFQIQDFAAKTPFSVSELTDSFVKLANQGFVPTTNEMRKLGDLAASTGKSFNQLTEAIIDAQTGEFERLKEFGIRAQKEGDKVTFTFKGVKQQVDFTNDSIRNYVLGLGDATGVSGSMAAISDTLGGRISNLGDAWDQFTLSLGKSSGVLKDVIGFMSDLLSGVTDLILGVEEVAKREVAGEAEQFFKYQREQFLSIAKAAEEAGKSSTESMDAYFKEQSAQIEGYIKDAQKELDKFNDDNNMGKAFGVFDTNKQEEAQKRLITNLVFHKAYLEALKDAQAKATEELDKNSVATVKHIGLIEQEEQVLKRLEEQRAAANTNGEVIKYNDLIIKQNEYIKNLKETTQEEYNLSKMRLEALSPKGYDNKDLFKPNKNAQLAYSIELETLKQVTAQLGIATTKSKVYGESFDFVGEKTNILTDALNYLIENGVDKSSFAIGILKEELTKLQGKIGEVTVDMSGLFASMVTGFAESMGTLIGGGQSLSNFFDSLILMVIDFASSFGKLLISAGIASEAFQKALTSNPYVAIAAGAALVAAAALAKSQLGKAGFGGATPMANGGLVYGPSLLYAGEYSGARNNPEVIAPLDKLMDYMPEGDGDGGNGTVVFEIDGTKLKGVLDKTEKRNNRTF